MMPSNENECRELFDFITRTRSHAVVNKYLHQCYADTMYLHQTRQNIDQAILFDHSTQSPRVFVVQLWQLLS